MESELVEKERVIKYVLVKDTKLSAIVFNMIKSIDRHIINYSVHRLQQDRYTYQLIKKYGDIDDVDWILQQRYFGLMIDKLKRNERLVYTSDSITAVMNSNDITLFNLVFEKERHRFTFQSLLSDSCFTNLTVFKTLFQEFCPQIPVNLHLELRQMINRAWYRNAFDIAQYIIDNYIILLPRLLSKYQWDGVESNKEMTDYKESSDGVGLFNILFEMFGRDGSISMNYQWPYPILVQGVNRIDNIRHLSTLFSSFFLIKREDFESRVLPTLDLYQNLMITTIDKLHSICGSKGDGCNTPTLQILKSYRKQSIKEIESGLEKKIQNLNQDSFHKFKLFMIELYIQSKSYVFLSLDLEVPFKYILNDLPSFSNNNDNNNQNNVNSRLKHQYYGIGEYMMELEEIVYFKSHVFDLMCQHTTIDQVIQCHQHIQRYKKRDDLSRQVKEFPRASLYAMDLAAKHASPQESYAIVKFLMENRHEQCTQRAVIQNTNIKTVQLLVESKPNIWEYMSIQLALDTLNLDLLKWTIEYFEKVLPSSSNYKPLPANHRNHQPLIMSRLFAADMMQLCSTQCCIDIIDFLYRYNGYSLDPSDKIQGFPEYHLLSEACSRGDLVLVKYLTELFGNDHIVVAPSRFKTTILDDAFLNGCNMELVHYMIENRQERFGLESWLVVGQQGTPQELELLEKNTVMEDLKEYLNLLIQESIKCGNSDIINYILNSTINSSSSSTNITTTIKKQKYNVDWIMNIIQSSLTLPNLTILIRSGRILFIKNHLFDLINQRNDKMELLNHIHTQSLIFDQLDIAKLIQLTYNNNQQQQKQNNNLNNNNNEIFKAKLTLNQIYCILWRERVHIMDYLIELGILNQDILNDESFDLVNGRGTITLRTYLESKGLKIPKESKDQRVVSMHNPNIYWNYQRGRGSSSSIKPIQDVLHNRFLLYKILVHTRTIKVHGYQPRQYQLEERAAPRYTPNDRINNINYIANTSPHLLSIKLKKAKGEPLPPQELILNPSILQAVLFSSNPSWETIQLLYNSYRHLFVNTDLLVLASSYRQNLLLAMFSEQTEPAKLELNQLDESRFNFDSFSLLFLFNSGCTVGEFSSSSPTFKYRSTFGLKYFPTSRSEPEPSKFFRIVYDEKKKGTNDLQLTPLEREMFHRDKHFNSRVEKLNRLFQGIETAKLFKYYLHFPPNRTLKHHDTVLNSKPPLTLDQSFLANLDESEINVAEQGIEINIESPRPFSDIFENDSPDLKSNQTRYQELTNQLLNLSSSENISVVHYAFDLINDLPWTLDQVRTHKMVKFVLHVRKEKFSSDKISSNLLYNTILMKSLCKLGIFTPTNGAVVAPSDSEETLKTLYFENEIPIGNIQDIKAVNNYLTISNTQSVKLLYYMGYPAFDLASILTSEVSNYKFAKSFKFLYKRMLRDADQVEDPELAKTTQQQISKLMMGVRPIIELGFDINRLIIDQHASNPLAPYVPPPQPLDPDFFEGEGDNMDLFAVDYFWDGNVKELLELTHCFMLKADSYDYNLTSKFFKSNVFGLAQLCLTSMDATTLYPLLTKFKMFFQQFIENRHFSAAITPHLDTFELLYETFFMNLNQFKLDTGKEVATRGNIDQFNVMLKVTKKLGDDKAVSMLIATALSNAICTCQTHLVDHIKELVKGDDTGTIKDIKEMIWKNLTESERLSIRPDLKFCSCDAISRVILVGDQLQLWLDIFKPNMATLVSMIVSSIENGRLDLIVVLNQYRLELMELNQDNPEVVYNLQTSFLHIRDYYTIKFLVDLGILNKDNLQPFINAQWNGLNCQCKEFLAPYKTTPNTPTLSPMHQLTPPPILN